jgi:hypothetical protein
MRSQCKAHVHAVLAKGGIWVPMTDLFGVEGNLLLDKVTIRHCKTSLGLRPATTTARTASAPTSNYVGAVLLIRVAETRTGDTWRNLRHELDRMHLVTLATAYGRVAQRSATTSDQQTILAALDLPEPPRYLDFTPGIDASAAD